MAELIKTLYLLDGTNTVYPNIVADNIPDTALSANPSGTATATLSTLYVKGTIYNISPDLSSYVTESELTSTLANYVTSTSLSTTLGSYLKTASFAEYFTKTRGQITPTSGSIFWFYEDSVSISISNADGVEIYAASPDAIFAVYDGVNTRVPTPKTANNIANKSYVDDTVGGVQSSLTTLQGTVTTMQTTVSSLQSSLTSLQNEYNTLLASHNALQAEYNELIANELIKVDSASATATA